MAVNRSITESTSTTLRSLFDSVGAYVYAKDRNGAYLYANKAICELFSRPLDYILGKTDADFMDIAHSDSLIRNDREVLERGAELHEEEQILLLHETEPRLFWTIKVPILGPRNEIVGLTGISSQLGDDVRHTSDAIRHNQLLNTILSNVDAYIYVKDFDGTYLYANQQVISLLGREQRDVIGLTDLDVHSPDVARRLMTLDRDVLDSQQRRACEELLVDSSGAHRHFWSIKMPIRLPGHPRALIGFSSDITELLALRRDAEQARTVDTLTGLLNRTGLEEALTWQIKANSDRQAGPALITINLDQFKYLNNSLGQSAGDEVLRQAALRLETASWLQGQLARVGGNTFVVLLAQIEGPEETAVLAEHIRLLLNEPYRLNDQPCHLTASLGIGLFPNDGRTAQALLANAESAMYHAKEQGRNRWTFYSSSLSQAATERLDLEHDLRAALTAHQFELYYQPKVAASDGRITGVEALIRWNRPNHGLIPPDRFIPLAEQLGLIVEMGDWVIEQACRQMAAWARDGMLVSIAVNLSPAQLSHPSLIERVATLIDAYAIRPGMLHMEVTESMMLNDPEQAIAHLQALRDLGVTLSIDDFGTGYSSMAYLKRLPVNKIKLDRSFIQQIASDPREADLCAGIIALAHKLGLAVVAEGVETREQQQILTGMECDVFQGYLFSKPMQIAAATQYLSSPRSPLISGQST
ncbi:GGDEF domain-containing protein [Pseudomonas abyssi]|uniref:cyclic-guanylate-specific phosphodiesterase n=1 Tax=Pseudomonas abyssi TaxID=170540 RepID=A0A2A3MF26_9PSED|nr:EAL domain-containing protein [Pseudomonas abyssi]MAD00303.1 phosphodiesterase [Pseudomonadales bacterium]PBK03372.1 GGDEF domain-containing protein [Pseudomonas abyssi]|tara:strand:- start:33842 stop:35938 length:2097 start_codon:yes stop_codon:yes gene_type:complete